MRAEEVEKLAETIPSQLVGRRAFVVYRLEPRKGQPKPTKVPYQPQKPTVKASPTNGAHWGSFAEACCALGNDPTLSGLGFVFGADDPFCGIDLDNCRDAESAAIEPWAQKIITDLDSYTELSPSQTGVHILIVGKKPGALCRIKDLEVYDQKRFFCMTGHHVEGTPIEIKGRQADLDILYEDTFPAPPSVGNGNGNGHGNRVRPAPTLEDAELLQKAQAAKNGALFTQLWNGDFSGYDSQSEADFALAELLAFWTAGDAIQIDRLFRQSGLWRDKWDERRGEETLGQFNINKILHSRTEYYRGNGDRPRPDDRERAPIPKTEAPSEQGHAFSQTDYGNAERLCQEQKGLIRFVHKWKKWVKWNGTQWEVDEAEQIMGCAKSAVRQMYAEAADIVDTKERNDLVKHAQASERGERLRTMISLATSEGGVTVTPAELDSHAWLVNCGNGTLDSKTGELLVHNPVHLLTKKISIDYDPDATCPLWENFLARIFRDEDGDPRTHLIAYVQRLLGYCLTGSTQEQRVFIFFGHGANGKTVLLETMNRILGDYAKSADFSTFSSKQTDQIRNDIARLCGARMVSASEGEAGTRLAESLIKKLTCEEQVTARFLFKENFQFVPTFKTILVTNHKPNIKGSDHAIWRRIDLIPFAETIPVEEQDQTLLHKLRGEYPGILAWLVRGCLDWQAHGLGMPEEVRDATASYKEEMDVLGSFLEDRCTVLPGTKIQSSSLYQAYTQWCEDNGEKPICQRDLSLQLQERGYRKAHTKTGTFWKEFGLNHEDDSRFGDR